jgi:DNA polymerase-3 subunit gamma/tau
VGTDVDVREIDGASYTGVDEVRKLQESLPYRPARDRFKIFIIDEVHMLSQNAWNAFLKTLEEPPDHVKFIFATTEAHKVPVTILSRVQRFDFKLIPTPLIVGRLRTVLDQESIRYDESALSIIGREAAGSMRDAMSLLDQVIAWADEGLTAQIVSKVLGVATRQVLLDLARALVSGDATGCLEIVLQLTNQGFDLTHVAKDVLSLLRDLVVAGTCESPARVLDVPDQEQAEIVQLASTCSTDDLLRLHQGFSRGLDDVLRSGQPRASLEMLLVRLARRPPLLPLDQILSRLGALERRLASPPPAAAAKGAETPRQRSSRTDQGRARSPHRTEPGARTKPREPEGSEEPPPAPSPAQEEAPAPIGISPPPAEDEPSKTELWQAAVARIGRHDPRLAATLEQASLLELGPERLRLGFEPASLPLYTALQPAGDAVVVDAISKELGSAHPVLSVEVLQGPPPHPTLSDVHQKERAQAARDAQERARTHPRVVAAQKVLGARLKTVRLPDER